MARHDIVLTGVAPAKRAVRLACRILLALCLVTLISPATARAQFAERQRASVSTAQGAVPAPPPGQPESLPALLARTLASEPQVRVAQSLWQATTERRWQALSRLGPTFGVNVTQGKSRETEFGLPLERRTERSDAVLRWNLYNHGNDAAELRATGLDERSAAHELRRAREEAAERIGGAYLDLESGRAHV